ncbi:RodZ domain-containing protein [Elusimicrobiota bacterium]
MSIGEELKKARESKGVTLNLISRDTKIPVDWLKALEENNYDEFPGKFYARSYLRTYAAYLGVALEIDEVLEADHDQSLNLVSHKRDKNTEKRVELSSRREMLSVLLGVMLLLGGGFYGAVKLKLIPPNIFEKQPEVQQRVLPVTDYADSGKIMIKGVVNMATWIRVKSDEITLYEGILAEGTTHFWEADKKLRLKIGYVHGMKVYYRKSLKEGYRLVDIWEGSEGDINELEFVNEPGK